MRSYSGRWHWPPQECDHTPERRVPANTITNQLGGELRHVPEYCRDCGQTFAAPRPPSEENAGNG